MGVFDPELLTKMQVGLTTLLKADAPLTALISGRVYDEPPEVGLDYPYVRFGNFSQTPEDTACDNAMEVFFGMEAHSRPNSGRLECNNVIGAVTVALHQQEASLTVANHRVVDMTFQTDTTPSGRTAEQQSYVAVAAFRCLIEPV